MRIRSTPDRDYAGVGGSGKREEARAVLEELKRRSTERYIPPYNIALVYNGLDERDETLDWLENGHEHRDVRMTFLKLTRSGTIFVQTIALSCSSNACDLNSNWRQCS